MAISATVDTTNASNITSGILSTSVLPSTINAIHFGDGSGLNNTNATNIVSGTIVSSLLPTSGVKSGSYGNTVNTVSITVDNYGRIVSVQNISISSLQSNYTSNASNLVTGTLSASLLPTSGVTSGNYGNPSNIVSLSVDTNGRITSTYNSSIKLSYTNVRGLAISATVDTTNASNITSGILSTSVLPSSYIYGTFQGDGSAINSINATNLISNTLNIGLFPLTGANAGIYGSSLNVAALTVDIYGRITSISNTSINFNVNGDITNASNITYGTISAARYQTSGVVAGLNGGSATNNNSLVIDIYGRVLSATNISSYVFPTTSYTFVTGLSRSATIDTTNITNITGYYPKTVIPSTINAYNLYGDGYGLGALNISNSFGSLPASCLPVSGVISGNYGSAINNIIITVDTYGRVTSISNVTNSNNLLVTISNASNIVSGIIPYVNLPQSPLLITGSYGSTSNSVDISIDQYGRISTISNTKIQFSYTDISGLSSTASFSSDSLSYYSDLATAQILIGNSSTNTSIYGSNIILNSSTNTVNNLVSSSLYQIPLYTSIDRNTSNYIPIPLNFGLSNYNNADIKLYLYPNTNTNISLLCYDSLSSVKNAIEPHNFIQYGATLGTASTISTTNITDTTSNVIINAINSNTIFIDMNISKNGSGGSNYYLIDSCYYNSTLNRIVHGTSSGFFIASSTTNLNTCLFSVQNGTCQYRSSVINYY